MTGPVLVGGVYAISHTLVLVVEPLIGARVHEVEPKLPPAPPSSHDTVPVGMLFVPILESKTLA